MANSKKDYEYEFINKLCSAIEIFTSLIEKNNPDTFIYKGANLKYALERVLYFIYYSDNDLYSIFYKWKTKKLPKTIIATNEIQKELALILCDNQINLQLKLLEKKYFIIFRYLLKIPVKISLNIFNNLINSLVLSSKRSKHKKNTVLFFINSEKFIRFLKPLLIPLKNNYLFYPSDKNAYETLKKENAPYIKCLQLIFNIKIFIRRNDYIQFYGLTDLYDCLYTLIDRLKPKKVVVVEGNSPDHEIMNQVCKQVGVDTVCLQQGWSPYTHNGFRNMSYRKMLVWGQGFAKLLQPYNPKQKFIATGSHIIRIKEAGKDNQTGKGISFFFQPPSRLSREEDLNKMFDLVKWAACEFPNYSIILREHPGHKFDGLIISDLKRFSNIRFMPSQEYKLEEVLYMSHLAVAIYSTTILESIAVGVLPLIFNVTSMPKYSPDVDAAGAGVEVKTLQEAKDTLARLIKDKKYYQSFTKGMNKFRKEYFAAGGEQAINNIIKELS